MAPASSVMAAIDKPSLPRRGSCIDLAAILPKVLFEIRRVWMISPGSFEGAPWVTVTWQRHAYLDQFRMSKLCLHKVGDFGNCFLTRCGFNARVGRREQFFDRLRISACSTARCDSSTARFRIDWAHGTDTGRHTNYTPWARTPGCKENGTQLSFNETRPLYYRSRQSALLVLTRQFRFNQYFE